MIPVTKSFLPPKENFINFIDEIWESNQLTNNGPLVRDLEAKLKDFLGVKHLFFVSNGTIALQIAIKALNLRDEVITTPFSYVATTSSLVWEGCQPVFVDIDPRTLCIDPELIEAAITKKTTGILPTHVYGIPCDVDKINSIAKKHGLKVLYDAAHTFGGKYKDKSIVSYGDISVLSFHATKLFHTVEGGALITGDDEIAQRISYMRNFGHKGHEDFWGLGVNGKNSELHAAMGLCVLPYVTEIIEARKRISSWYDEYLNEKDLSRPVISQYADYNYGYYPELFSSEMQLLQVKAKLNENQIFPRRYFYPSLTELPYTIKQQCPVTRSVSSRIACLPLYPELDHNQIVMISKIIKDNLS